MSVYAQISGVIQNASDGILNMASPAWDELSDDEFSNLVRMLPGSAVDYIDLSVSKMTSDRLVELARVLPSTNVTNLQFRNATFEREALVALVQALPQSSITLLDLRDCKLGNEGIALLMPAIAASGVNQLNIARNNITAAGASTLSRYLPDSQLNFINLTGNPLEEAGLHGLLSAIQVSAITSLEVDIQGAHEMHIRCREAAKKNDAKALKGLNKIIHPTNAFTAEDWQEAEKLLPAIMYNLAGQTVPRGTVIQETLLTCAEKAMQYGYDCRSFVLKLLPVKDALQWLTERGQEMTVESFLNDEGRIPQDRFICQKGALGLASIATELVHTPQEARQLRLAFAHLPQPVRASIPNMHSLSAKLSSFQSTGHAPGGN